MSTEEPLEEVVGQLSLNDQPLIILHPADYEIDSYNDIPSDIPSEDLPAMKTMYGAERSALSA